MSIDQLPGPKAILVAALGTSFPEVRQAAIDKICQRISQRFPDWEVRLAFTSEIIIRKIRERDGEVVDNPQQALERLNREGFRDVAIQPLHVVPGWEWKKVLRAVRQQRHQFARVALGRPLLFFSRGEQTPDDYRVAVEALSAQLPRLEEDQGVLLMAHGSSDPANASYPLLERILHESGFPNVLLASVEGYPELADVLPVLKRRRLRELTLMPFMVVAGDHVRNDMAGEGEDSWINQLEREGYRVKVYLKGLGENEKVQEIYVRHLEEAVAGAYDRFLSLDLE